MNSVLAAISALALPSAFGEDQPQKSAFDPSGYLDDKAKSETIAAEQLTKKAIYRIQGRRYHKFETPVGAVFLPGAGEMPDMHEELAVCSHHLRLMGEVLPMREGLAIDAATKKLESKIVAMIRKCQEGKIAGPTVLIENPDGAQVELKATPKAQKEDAGRKNTAPNETR